MSTGTVILRRSVLTALFALLLSTPSFATVFGPGTINWRYEGQDGPPYRVVFTLQLGLRWSAGWSFGPALDGPFSPGVKPPLGSWLDLLPSACTTCTTVTPFQVYRDGSDPDEAPPIRLFGKVTAVDPASDLFYITATAPVDFAWPGLYRAEVRTGARLSNLRNRNSDLPYILGAELLIDPASPQDSPVAPLPPTVHISKNQVTSFSLGAIDPDGDALRYDFAPTEGPEDSGLITRVPYCGDGVYSQIRFVWLDSATGIVTVYTPDGARNPMGEQCPPGYPVALGLYLVQFRVMDIRRNLIPLEMLIDVDPPSSGSPPEIAINGSTEPPTFVVTPGSPVTFEVTGSDSDEVNGVRQDVTLLSGPLPQGATMTATLPITSLAATTSNFTWTPTTENWGDPALGTYMMTFAARDSTSLQSTLPVTIKVLQRQPPVVTCTIPATLEASSSAGGTLEVVAEVGDPDSASATVTWVLDGSDVDTDSLALPTWPERASTSWSYALGFGSHTILVKASDEENMPATCQGTVLVHDTTPPVIPPLANLTIEATSSGGAVVPYVVPDAMDAVDGARPLACTPATGSTFPIGTRTVGCSVTDRAGNSATAAFTVTVRDTTPPVIGKVVPSPNVLWPPNHKVVPVAVRYSVTDSSGATCALAVTSNEPDNGLGDGDTRGDWRVVSPTEVALRAERAGTGQGRVYTLTVTCTDAYGNASTADATVMAPKGMKGGRN